MIDVPGGLLDELEEMHCESETVICQTFQVGHGHANLCLKSVEAHINRNQIHEPCRASREGC